MERFRIGNIVKTKGGRSGYIEEKGYKNSNLMKVIFEDGTYGVVNPSDVTKVGNLDIRAVDIGDIVANSKGELYQV